MVKKLFQNAANTIPEYGAKTPHHSPFMKAKQEWDNRMGEPIKQKRNWQIAAGCFAVLAIGSLAILGYREVYAPLPAYAVPVDGNGLGAGKSVAIAEARYVPNRAQVAADISKWIILVRSRPADGFTLGANLRLAEVFMHGEGIAQLNAYKEKYDPFKHYRHTKDYSSKITVSVTGPNPSPDPTVLTFPKVTQLEGNSYYAEWQEVQWEYGTPGKPYRMSMTVRATADGQTDQRKMDVNPGGTSIRSWDWRGEEASK
jgi:type IV secretory pathway TrbF-like protein